MKVVFVQPFTVNASLADECQGKTVVLDVAFNAGIGEQADQQFEDTTVAFIQALKEQHKLVAWLDHHPHKAWPVYKDDPRFVLVPRTDAPACPPLVTPQFYLTCTMTGPIETIVCHGDFDGIMSAIKFALGGKEPYPGCDLDSIAIDSRIGEYSEVARGYDEALKADLSDDSVRQALFTLLTVDVSDELSPMTAAFLNALEKVVAARHTYFAIQAETIRLSSLFDIQGRVAFINTTNNEQEQYDLTQLLLAGQKQAEVAVVLHGKYGCTQATIAGPKHWNFVELFGLSGGMPNLVNLRNWTPEQIIKRINDSKE